MRWRWAASFGAVGLPAVVGVALIVRLWAFGGVSFAHNADDGRYAAVARNLSLGHLPEGDAEWFGWRMTFLWPVAALFRVFGASDYSAVAWPLVGSLAAVVAAGLIGRHLGGARVGLLAATLVALAPLEVIMGTRLRPDALVPAFVGFSVWCALRAGTSRGRALWWAAGAGALLGAGWFVRESILIVGPVVILAGRRAGWRAMAAGTAGLGAIAALAAVLAVMVGATAWSPIAAAPGQTVWRNPITVLSWDDSYLARMVRAIDDPGHPLFLLAPTLAIAAAIAVWRWQHGHRLNALVFAWLGWVLVYLELGTLVNLDKPLRFLTLASIPLALALALVLARLPIVASLATLVVVMGAMLGAVGSLSSAEARDQDVVLLNRVAADLAGRPPGPVLAESFVWQRKLAAWNASERLSVASVVDPMLLTTRQRVERRRLDPLPDPAAYRGGYVVTAPVRARRGWPSNWGDFRDGFRDDVPWEQLRQVGTVGEATIYHWPPDAAEPG